MPALATPHGRIVTFTSRTPRQRLISRIEDIVGRDRIRLLWIPDGADGLVTVEDSLYRRPMTHSHTPQGRLTRQGDGWLLSFVSATGHWLTTPDADSLTFFNGSTDQTLHAFSVVNVTNTAAVRTIVAKYGAAGAREWFFLVNASDVLQLGAVDESAGAVSAIRASDAAITQGSLVALAGKYSVATGEATAANDMALASNGTAIASTATNNASYVAMENLGQGVEIGSIASGGASRFDGSIGLVLVTLSHPTTQQDAALVDDACNPYFQVNL